MKRLVLISLVSAFCMLSVRPRILAEENDAPKPDAEGFVSLFDGKSLKGWHGGKKLWKVEKGAIVGTSDGTLKDNTFLISEKSYRNFILKVSFKLEGGNSGVQFRSIEKDDYIVIGYQADIAPEYWGLLYDEKRRLILLRPDEEAVRKAAVEPDGWNHYVITAHGPKIKFALNGITVIEYTEEEPEAKIPREGIIALQLHRGPAMKARFKDIKIKVLR